ncbi:ribonucleases P/MRP protein subunit POP1 [Drosophila grimshawi]|uniref:GH12857 n=1 Tax=Drosophila grimshawi TaxID=7222 RepID=B4JLG7_DROGR|nr:ribonucleases P/MRP protein subunit POP1 [Drosophila grimshawi]EDW00420.1 GH12857 [Drosophila grimshawi]
MSTQKLEYDANLGGRITLPTHVSTYHYAAGALQEIKSLIADAQLPASSKLIFQTLPKHMRRRAMSHHPKRLPRKHRAAHKSQMGKAGNQPVNSKRPSRKYRRRPKNLMREYVRRQRKHIWLETHIWHAKRFFMIDRWGYRLPYASCDKTYRACYRASAEHCLLQDISYYSCVQLNGSLELLCPGLARLTSPHCGLTMTAKAFLSGRREGSVQLFADGQYPLGALQTASFMWRPQVAQDEPDDVCTLWLWLHPAAAEATILQLINVFQLKSTKQQKHVLPPEAEVANAKDLRFWTHTVAFERHRSYVNVDDNVKLLVLKQEFNRFRLTGPRAQRILSASLRAQRPHDYLEAALQLSSPSELLSNLIVGVNVVDPRLQRPRQRTKAAEPTDRTASAREANELLVSRPDSLPYSDLWEPEVRERLGQQMLTTHQYNQLRQQHAVVPGEPCAFEEQLQPVPLLLIQRPGSQQPHYKRLGYGSGWDVIAPARYGMSLWLTLIMWGARPGGLREFDTVAREMGVEHHLPDTVAGRDQASRAAAERRTRYFRLPPNKRCNYRKLAVVSPFLAPWQQLVRDWSPATPAGFYVLRDRAVLQRLDECVRRRQALPEPLPGHCLIQIQLRLQSRGQLGDNALICLPTRSDWKRRWQQLKRDDHAPVHSEPPQPDLNERLRKELRNSHKCLLKRLRGRRVREKRRLQETSTRRVKIRPANTAQMVRDQLTKMCRLWLPTDPVETCDSVRRQCSREVFGYVSSAGFSFVEATVCAVGYITPGGLRHLLEAGTQNASDSKGQPPLCLVRDVDSRAYRFARFQINANVTAGV